MSSPYLPPSMPRWVRLAFYLAVLVIPGGSILLLLVWGLTRVRADSANAPRWRIFTQQRSA
jgi:hypothetical protein